jgi:thioesterase domain-containing protein
MTSPSAVAEPDRAANATVSTLPDPGLLQGLQAELLAMPPVAAMGLRVVDADDHGLRLSAPLALNVNDKGCAFGGSLTSVMTLAGWGLVNLRLAQAGVQAEVYVAESQVRYRAPVFSDLTASARLADGEDWGRFMTTLLRRGRARIGVVSDVPAEAGTLGCECQSQFAAILKSA